MKYPSENGRKPTALLILLILSALLSFAAHAEFVLNFQPQLSRIGDPEWLNFNCNRPAASGSFESCDENDEFRGNNGRDTTPFLLEHIRDPVTGATYYHTIIGLPGDDFVQEAYIKITRQMGGDDRGPVSDSLGNWSDITNAPNNAYDPLGPSSFSGSGTANPKSTQFRQQIKGDGFDQEIIKAFFNKKPSIVQDIDSGGMRQEFDLDMTNSTYDEAGVAGIMRKNQQVITQGSFTSTFDIHNMPASAGSDVHISGGKFLYSQRYTTSMSGGPFLNEYVGEGADYNIWAVEWDDWRDPAQNQCVSFNNNSGTGGPCHLYGTSGGN